MADDKFAVVPFIKAFCKDAVNEDDIVSRYCKTEFMVKRIPTMKYTSGEQKDRYTKVVSHGANKWMFQFSPDAKDYYSQGGTVFYFERHDNNVVYAKVVLSTSINVSCQIETVNEINELMNEIAKKGGEKND